METNEMKNNENDYDTVPNIGFTGFLQDADVDYQTQRNSSTISINGGTPIRMDDLNLDKILFSDFIK
jgi:hypothetical protein